MTNYAHAAVWLDHAEAKIFKVEPETFEITNVHAPHHHVHRHPTHTRETQHPADEQHYYHEIVVGLKGAAEILVLGPANAKLEFMKHVRKHDPLLEQNIFGVESSDHPTEGEIAAVARRFFHDADQARKKSVV